MPKDKGSDDGNRPVDKVSSIPRKKPKKNKYVKLEPDPDKTVTLEPAGEKHWWEIWQESQSIRSLFFDQEDQYAEMLPAQKVSEATAVFSRNRTWPSAYSQVRNRWDQFQVFAGLLENAVGDEYLRLNKFADDPCSAIQIYLSSYFIEKGLNFSPYACDIIPKLLFFYANYLLVNCILPDKEDNLHRALSIIETAKMELALFPTIGRTQPDHFNQTCKEVFNDPPTTTSMQISTVDAIDAPAQDESPDRTQVEVVAEEGTSTALSGKKRRRKGKQKSKKTEEIDFQAGSRSPILDPAVPAGDAVPDPMGGEKENQTTTTDSSWGDIEPSGWTTSPMADVNFFSGWGGASGSGWGSSALSPLAQASTTDKGWGDFPICPLSSSFVPAHITNSLPQSYVRGVVEHSVRRIKAIFSPVDAKMAKKIKHETDEVLDLVALEQELTRSYWTAVLEPWPRIESGSLITTNVPCILSSSKGRVDLQVVDQINIEEGSENDREVGKVKPHNCLTDEITIFLQDEPKECLKDGMGLGGTWVQLLRTTDCVRGGDGTGTECETRFWYAQDVLKIWPSYFVV
ncbi:hypothetical protein D9757_006146 [Collybiopsis confluens]|uniref:Uncharacterized protein n=1 Tax=Collybiopsis confluens TaxID=2823264 RepID=A0A8H5HHA0_9AGAR|nr:hypothetical protein D9757_006146 [Collybiopsis confluens]